MPWVLICFTGLPSPSTWNSREAFQPAMQALLREGRRQHPDFKEVRMQHTDRSVNRAEQDRLQPALLDRLTDHDPRKRSERIEAVYVNEARLRAALLRDLAWLLNAINASSHIDFEGMPAVENSVVNFGVKPLAGLLLSELEWRDVEQSIRQSVLTFEPRILPDTLLVALQESSASLSHHNTLQFEIRCHFWSLPYPLELLLKTSLDLETGQIVMSETRG